MRLPCTEDVSRKKEWNIFSLVQARHQRAFQFQGLRTLGLGIGIAKKVNSRCEFTLKITEDSLSIRAGGWINHSVVPDRAAAHEIENTAYLRGPEILRGRRNSTNYLDTGTHYKVLLTKL